MKIHLSLQIHLKRDIKVLLINSLNILAILKKEQQEVIKKKQRMPLNHQIWVIYLDQLHLLVFIQLILEKN